MREILAAHTRVVVVPQQAVTIVIWELVVEVMETFAPSPERDKDAVTWRTLITVSGVTPVVRQTVDEESKLLNEHGLSEACNEQATEPVTPAKTSDQRGHDQAEEDGKRRVVAVLELQQRIGLQVTNVSLDNLVELRAPSITPPEHPANVRVEETTLGIVRIFDRVRESVVNSVVVTPAEARAFKSPSSHHQERCLDDRMGVVGAMRPQSVVPRSDANATDVEHNEGQDGCLELDANKERRNDTEEGGHDEPNSDSPIELGEQSADAKTGAVVGVQVLPQRGLLDALENVLNDFFLLWKYR